MKHYTKIPNIYERNHDTKKLMEGMYSLPELEYLKDCEWIGTEKIDGTNIGVVWDGYRVTFQGRTEKAEIPKHLLEKLNEMFGGPENEEVFESLFGDKPMVLFGEGYGYKIQGQVGSNYLGDECGFILFDVYSVETETWLPYFSITDIATTLKCKYAPLVFRGTLVEAVEFIKGHPVSEVSKTPMEMEGIVCKPTLGLLNRGGGRIIVKIKTRDWK